MGSFLRFRTTPSCPASCNPRGIDHVVRSENATQGLLRTRSGHAGTSTACFSANGGKCGRIWSTGPTGVRRELNCTIQCRWVASRVFVRRSLKIWNACARTVTESNAGRSGRHRNRRGKPYRRGCSPLARHRDFVRFRSNQMMVQARTGCPGHCGSALDWWSIGMAGPA